MLVSANHIVIFLKAEVWLLNINDSSFLIFRPGSFGQIAGGSWFLARPFQPGTCIKGITVWIYCALKWSFLTIIMLQVACLWPIKFFSRYNWNFWLRRCKLLTKDLKKLCRSYPRPKVMDLCLTTSARYFLNPMNMDRGACFYSWEIIYFLYLRFVILNHRVYVYLLLFLWFLPSSTI